MLLTDKSFWIGANVGAWGLFIVYLVIGKFAMFLMGIYGVATAWSWFKERRAQRGPTHYFTVAADDVDLDTLNGDEPGELWGSITGDETDAY